MIMNELGEHRSYAMDGLESLERLAVGTLGQADSVFAHFSLSI